jgi:hypothetical protein
VTFGNYLPLTLNQTMEEFMGFLQLMLVGRLLTDGRLNARLKFDLTENLSLNSKG